MIKANTLNSELLTIVFSTSIALNILASVLILFSGIQRQKTHYFALFILSVFTVIYQYTTWNYHLSVELENAVFWLKIQTSSVLIAISAYFTVFAYWGRHQRATSLSLTIISISGVLALFNLLSDYSLRYESVIGLRTIELFNGEKINVLNGVASNIGVVLHIFYLSVIIGLVFFIIRLFKRKHLTVAIALLVTLLLQIFSSYVGMGIDSGRINAFYIAGMPFTLLSVWFCFLIASTLDIQTKRLKVQVRKRQDLELAMSKLAKDISSLDTETFYQSMLEGIYELYKFDIAFIGLQSQQGKIESLSAIQYGKSIESFSYSLANTPCEKVMDNKVCVHSQHVAKLFPHDKLLIDLNATGYIGFPLMGENNELAGLLAVLHSKEIAVNTKMLETLEIFAHRAASELKRNNAEKKLRTIAYFDYATSLPNRVKLFEELNEQNKNNIASDNNSILMLIDLDRFTEVNKSFGYDAGEFVLRELGLRLSHYGSDDIFIARNGGDEFAIILRKVNSQPIAMLNVHWEAVRAIIATPIMYGKSKITVNSSMGAVIFPEQTADKFDVIRAGETALQQAKIEGRDQNFLFDPRLLQTMEKHRELEEMLSDAISVDDGQLYLVYQPKTFADGTLAGAEALMRWQHPEHGFISPAEFIPIAENTRLINRLGDFLIVKVCQQIQYWRENNEQELPKVSINISTIQLSEDDFFTKLINTVNQYDVSPSQIEIELTETGLLKNIKQAVEKLLQLQKFGFTIALDDFGTGYSSLSYLHDLPLNVLKIDKSFIDNINDESASDLIRSIISIGKNLNLDVVAEGTETIEQVEKLASMGCEVFQGYFFSKPLTPNEFIKWQYTYNTKCVE